MDKKRYNELILLSQQIHDAGNASLKSYFEKTYAGAGAETMDDQLEDWLFVAEETAAYQLGNVLAMLEPASREEEIQTFIGNLRKVISTVEAKQAGDETPDRLQ